MTAFIGTSGWTYDHWAGRFYPEDLPTEQWLEYYADRFPAVEINNTFYQLPADKTLDTWRDTVPRGFRFAVKASRYITHMKKLKDPRESIARFFAKAERLGDRLGPILFQLPPNWHANPERLEAFIEALPDGHRYVFEFRDPDWWNETVADILAAHDCAFCPFDLAGQQSPVTVTTDFVYIRLHGPDGAYAGRYTDQALDQWSERMRDWQTAGKSTWCFFDNDAEAQAAKDARRLLDRLGNT